MLKGIMNDVNEDDFAFDSNDTLNRTGKAINMKSNEYVSCELYYLRN